MNSTIQKQIQDFMDNFSRDNRNKAEIAIIEYIDKHNLTSKDIKENGEMEHYINSQKIVYKYKNDIICEIDLRIEFTMKTPAGDLHYKS